MKWLKFFRGHGDQGKVASPRLPSPAPSKTRPAESPDPIPCCEPTRNVLLVGGNPSEASRMLERFSELGSAWRCQTVSSGAEARGLLNEKPFDAIIVHGNLDGSSSLDLIEEVARDFPKVVRIIRHAADEKKSAGKAKGLPPCYLEHNHDRTELLGVLRRAFQLDAWTQGEPVKALLLRMENLPAVPSLYARVLVELRSDDPSIEAVGKLVAKDPALTAKMLQLVNSPHFALGRPVSDAVEAVTFLGAERTKALILMASLSLHGNMTPCEGFSQDQFWQHSLSVGTMARNIAKAQTKDASLADQAFTAGLLHDIGKLLFAANLPREYGPVITTAINERVAIHEVERQAFGIEHSKLGAGLLGTWGLPMPVLEALAWHHAPLESSDHSFTLLTAVHASNALDHEKKGGGTAPCFSPISEEYIGRLNLADNVMSWREICGCPPLSGSHRSPG